MNNMFYTNNIYYDDLKIVAELSLPWEQIKGKSILIAGATGLICSFMVDVLMCRNENFGDNIKIFAMGRNKKNATKRFHHYFNEENFIFLEHDVIKTFNYEYHFDYIVHGASNSYPQAYSLDPVGTIQGNIFGINNILEYAINHNIKRTLYISSGEIYGQGNCIGGFKEDYSGYVDCINPRSSYPSGKRTSETLSISYSKQYNLDVVIARPCHIYGAPFTNMDNRAVPQFIRNVLNNQDIVLKSDGMQMRSYCYIVDCVSALLTILFYGKKGQAYNIADEKSEITIRNLAQIIANYENKKIVFENPDDIEKVGYSLITNSVLCSDKLFGLGWTAKFDIKTGLKRTINILKSMKESFDNV